MLASYLTFSLANAIAFSKVNLPELMNVLPGMICSAVGMGIGMLVKRLKN